MALSLPTTPIHRLWDPGSGPAVPGGAARARASTSSGGRSMPCASRAWTWARLTSSASPSSDASNPQSQRMIFTKAIVRERL